VILLDKIIKLYNKYREIINYLIFGVLTTIVSLTIKYLLLFTLLDTKKGIDVQIAVIISWIGAVLFAYVTNRKFVFESNNTSIFRELCNFMGARLLTLFMEMIIMYFFVTFLELNSDSWIVVVMVVGQVVVMVGNYLFSKIFVFRKDD
jgi:putative flippase GtrA